MEYIVIKYEYVELFVDYIRNSRNGGATQLGVMNITIHKLQLNFHHEYIEIIIGHQGNQFGVIV